MFYTSLIIVSTVSCCPPVIPPIYHMKVPPTPGPPPPPRTATSFPSLSRPTLGTVTIKNHTVATLTDVQVCAEASIHSAVSALDCSRSGVLVGAADGSIRLLNADLDEVLFIDCAHRGSVSGLEWHSDGIHFLSFGTDRCVRVWSVATRSGRLGAPVSIQPILSVPHSCSVTAAVFDPRGLSIDDLQPSTVWLLSAGTDGRLRAWRGPLLDQYESIAQPGADASKLPTSIAAKLDTAPSPRTSQQPVANQTSLALFGRPGTGSATGSPSRSSPAALVAVGCGNGAVSLFRYCDGFFTTRGQVTCKNRRGKFSNGEPVHGLAWIKKTMADDELLVNTGDHRIRVIRVSGKDLKVVGKFKGHVGKQGLSVHVLKGKTGAAGTPAVSSCSSAGSHQGVPPAVPPSAVEYLMCGSDDGAVFFWRRDGTEIKSDGEVETDEAFESFTAVERSDKLTACVTAPWEPEASEALLSACLVVGTAQGWVRVFYNRGAPGKVGK